MLAHPLRRSERRLARSQGGCQGAENFFRKSFVVVLVVFFVIIIVAITANDAAVDLTDMDAAAPGFFDDDVFADAVDVDRAGAIVDLDGQRLGDERGQVNKKSIDKDIRSAEKVPRPERKFEDRSCAPYLFYAIFKLGSEGTRS